MSEISIIIDISLGGDGIRFELEAENDDKLKELIDYAIVEFYSQTRKHINGAFDSQYGKLLSQISLMNSTNIGFLIKFHNVVCQHMINLCLDNNSS